MQLALKDEAAALMALPGAEQRLELTQADLLDYGSLVEAFMGCDGVFHTSSPSDVISNYSPEMADFEVRGTLNIVEACANSSVKRLVLTSSLAAMVWDQQRHAEKVIDEKCWSNLELCRSKKLWGPLTKTMTEKAAWSLARDKELDMVVINPAIVLGPRVFGTTQNIFTYLKGVTELPQSGLFAYAHVEDVAEAHVRALEATEATGRYICYETVVSEEKLVELIRKLYPDSKIPSRFSKNGVPHVLSNEKIKKLGMVFPAQQKLH
nr:cinnamoyl-CoA reductase 1-like isoform X2 [Physcomitrium patens]|eukprot:XP_024387852.1 cinnamoyl-CoA reductase 1-like isoform X2 [Physcomitrella patens]